MHPAKNPILLEILFIMNQLDTMIMQANPNPPIETSKAWIAGRPAMMRK
jgi:hypothetical protein